MNKICEIMMFFQTFSNDNSCYSRNQLWALLAYTYSLPGAALVIFPHNF